MNRHLLVAVTAAFLAACAAKDTKPAARVDPEFVFPHTPHVEGEVDCLSCHASIVKDSTLEARVRHVALPKKNSDACNGCHDDKEFKDKISKKVIPARTRAFSVRFNHAAHLAKPGVTCTQCHTALPDPGQEAPPRLSMSACTACHQHQRDFAEARCTPCHVDLKQYEKPVAAFQHAGDFLKTHGQLARPTAESCAQCHEQTYCADCHSATTAPGRQAVIFPEAVQRDFIHRGDYVSRHMIEAGASPASCRKCHGSKFCESCHEQQNRFQPPTSALQPINPHPSGWGLNKAGGNFHGTAARKNIVACAGCHDNGPTAICINCHKSGDLVPGTGQPMPSPHPASWNKKISDIAKNKMCGACHT
ncbi:MAG: hypothetical protein IPO09_05115 [Anaeromyxobacter sp.]|nr:hypothetical protein [Anaeromyxobacter sp.]MBL0277470.1 hypothetical protein [Anaeromyxobacter sp.]